MTREHNYIIEFVQVGDYVKVSAIDPVSTVEVAIVGAPSAGDAVLKRTAVRKLEYVLAKKRAGGRDPAAGVR